MKLALGLVFLINLQIIAAATSFWLPITYGTLYKKKKIYKKKINRKTILNY